MPSPRPAAVDASRGTGGRRQVLVVPLAGLVVLLAGLTVLVAALAGPAVTRRRYPAAIAAGLVPQGGVGT